MKVRRGDLGCLRGDSHVWGYDALIKEWVCHRCGILEAWLTQDRINDTARRLLDA